MTTTRTRPASRVQSGPAGRPRPALGERMLLALSRAPGTPDLPGGTLGYTIDNALDFQRRTVPGFLDLVRDRTVLDFGCGPGWQAIAMARAGAREVVGIDIHQPWIEKARTLAAEFGCNSVSFDKQIDQARAGTFDVVLSSNSFEHFADPAAILARMRDAARPGGLVVITFAEPWLSPYGSHMSFFTRVPWVNILFRESTVMRVRNRFRADGAVRYEDVSSGLNRMTLARFERIIGASGMSVEQRTYFPVRGLPFVTRIPGVRELLVTAVSCVLRKPAATNG